MRIRSRPHELGYGFDCCNAVFQHDVVGQLLEPQPGQPAPMHQRPGRAIVMAAVAQQKAYELLSGLPQAAHGCQAGTDQIAHRFMGRVWNPHGCQRTSPVQTHKVDRVPTVRLDPVAPACAGSTTGPPPRSRARQQPIAASMP